MNLNEYESKIAEIKNSDLPDDEKANALEMLADEIDRCAWHGHARQRANDVARAARNAMPCSPTLAGLNGLAARGAITRR